MAIHDSDLKVKTELNTIVEALPALSPAYEDLKRDVSILNSLRYPSMSSRHLRIPLAQAKTFEWVFSRRDEPTNPGPGFLEWLEESSGFFWITGKPGAGKSTLMKYLYDDRRTAKALRRWAGTDELIMAHHYFWKAGTDMQQSQEGLLQSLLYDIFRQAPGLIHDLCPARWSSPDNNSREEAWARHELYNTLIQVHSSRASGSSSKFCFFIDGLDEYDGDPLELIDVVKGMAPATNIKICVSSRPWQEFLDAFDTTDTPSLQLERLTAKDIRTYVNDKLMEEPGFARLCNEDTQYAGFVQEVVDRAHGVFFWVFLAVRALRRDMSTNDTINDCLQRLHAIPSDLDEYFTLILTSTPAPHREETARLLQTSSAAHEPQLVFTLSFFSDPTFKAAFAERRMLRNDEKMGKLCADGASRIRVRCRDLLRVVQDSPIDKPRGIPGDRVEFLHRTVRDFVAGVEVQRVLEGRYTTPFNADSYLARSYLIQIKVVEYASAEQEVHGLVDKLMLHASAAENATHAPDSTTLDELETFGLSDETYMKDFYGPALGFRQLRLDYGWVAALAVQYKCPLYVSQRLAQDPPQLQKISGRSLLDFALTLPMKSTFALSSLDQDLAMVRLLLEMGLSPNDTYEGRSVWSRFLAKIWGDMPRASERHRRVWGGIIVELLGRGADRGAVVGGDVGKDGEVLPCVVVLRRVCLPGDWERVRRAIDGGGECGG